MKKLILFCILFFIFLSLSAVNLSIWVGPDQNYWEASWNLKIMATGNWYYNNNQTFNEAWNGYTRTFTLTPGSFRLYYWDSGGDGGLAGDIWSYAWNVSSWDHEDCTGSYGYFSFIIPYLDVEEPNGNEELVMGDSFEIEWDSNFFDGSDYEEDIDINLIKNGDVYLSIVESYDNEGNFDWEIPDNLPPDNDYKIEIIGEIYDEVFDWSDDYFSIVNSDYIEVTIPNGGESWQAGTSHTILWDDNISENVNIQLIKNEQWYDEITSSTSSDGSFDWIMPSNIEADDDYKIKIESNNNNSIVGYSDNFTIFLQDFVYKNGLEFGLNGEFFNFVGTNCYYLMDKQSWNEYNGINEVMDLAINNNVNVIRTWGFNDLPSDSTNALQVSPGEYQEFVWTALDSIIYKASQRNLKLIIPLVNYWEDYGGMKQYIIWYNELYNPNYPIEQEYFYSEPIIKQWFKNYIYEVLNRENHITNVSYKDDPTIIAWELANEPRIENGNMTLFSGWIEEIANFIQNNDYKHLVGLGSEGNYNGNLSINYFTEINSSDYLDFSTLHLYVEPDHLNLNSIQEVEDFISERIDSSHSNLGKPFILEEFGFDRNFIDNYGNDRLDYYQAIYDQIDIDSGSGSNFWVLFPDEFSNMDDGYGVFPDDTDLLGIISGAGGVTITEDDFMSQPNISNIQNFPNPFNPRTTISFSIPKNSNIEISIFNIKGQKIKSLVKDFLVSRNHSIVWNGNDDTGKSVNSGVYLYKLEVNGKTEAVRKCLLLK